LPVLGAGCLFSRKAVEHRRSSLVAGDWRGHRLGMQAKYTMGFFAIGIAAAVVLTDARRYLKSKWLWYGVALSILIFLPNLIWQARNQFISLEFLQTIHARDVRIGRARDFLPGQLKIMLLGIFVFLAGLHYTLFSRDGKRFRMLGWMYLIPLALS